jgi:hypothetical protein
MPPNQVLKCSSSGHAVLYLEAMAARIRRVAQTSFCDVCGEARHVSGSAATSPPSARSASNIVGRPLLKQVSFVERWAFFRALRPSNAP